MVDADPCEICKTETARTQTQPGYDGIEQDCPRCGRFKITGTAMTMVRNAKPHLRPLVSGWVRNQNLLGDIPEITSTRYPLIISSPMPGVAERANTLLKCIVRATRGISHRTNIEIPSLVAATYSIEPEEVAYLANYLKSEGLVDFQTKAQVQVTPHGHMKYEELQQRASPSSQAFIAMWFDASMNPAYLEGIEPAVLSTKYTPIRIDRTEHTNKIDDEIIAQIRKSRFVIADFTGQRGGVYFEAGFALGLNIPVIWSCRQDDIGKLHFDVRQFNCIDWLTPNELQQRLRSRIEAVIGPGPFSV